MTKLLVPPGVPLALAAPRLAERSWASGTLTGSGVDTATSSRAGATCTASATPHTKGAWQEIIATTAAPANVIDVYLTAPTFVSGTNTRTLLDIGIGAAAAEVTIVSNVQIGFRTNSAVAQPVFRIPVPTIAQGTRAAIRCQSAVASKTVSAFLALSYVPGFSCGQVVTLGDDTATSAGTALTAPAGTNTKAAWTPITAATTLPFVALALGVQINTTNAPDATMIFDVGVGASGSEVVRVGDVDVRVSSSEVVGQQVGCFATPVAAGSRIAVRYARSASVTPNVVVYVVTP